ncbi:MAG: metallophosphoesterase [Vicinamibacterales bacterium]
MRRCVSAFGVIALAGLLLAAGSPTDLPNAPNSLKLAVLGDNGTGDRRQDDLAAQMVAAHKQFAYALVLMVGDNFYGSQKPADLEHKFARPYRPLLDAGVVFQAALGNHDDISTIDYAPINMRGQRYYTFVRQNVRFFVLDTNILDAAQLKWTEAALQQASEPWKIAYFHHPLYSNARRHGSNVDIRVRLEPLLVQYGVQVVFAGHDHVYERLKPQKGIHHFVTGSGGKLRKGDLGASDTTAAGFDEDNAFMMVEILGDDLHFRTVSRTGATVDSGHIRRMAPRIGS